MINKLGLQQAKFFVATTHDEIKVVQQFIGQLQLGGIVPVVRRVSVAESIEELKQATEEMKRKGKE